MLAVLAAAARFPVGSEFSLIKRHFDRPAPGAVLGVGDDCALLRTAPGMELAVSTDMLVEGRHFLSTVNPEALGHKTLAVNLGDLAAMGAEPLGFTLALALPQANDSEAQWAAQLQSAIGDACVVWPRMGLADLRQCMAESGGVIGVDSGLVHLAVALDLPTVMIFSQPRVARAGPIGRAHQTAVGGDTAPEPPAVWAAWQSVALVERAGVPTTATKVTAPNDITPLSPGQGSFSP